MTMTIALGGPNSADATRVASGHLFHRTVDITSYTTGGESFAPSDFGLSDIYFVGPISSENGYILVWDEVNDKLKVHEGTAVAGDPGDEQGAGIDSGTFDLVIYGY